MKKKKKEKRRLIFICLIGRFSFMKNSHSRPFSQSPFKCGLICLQYETRLSSTTWYVHGIPMVVLLSSY